MHEIKLAISNWNSLDRGLVWNTNKDNPQSGYAQIGLPFKAPDTELLSLMKLGKLALWLRVQPKDLQKISIESRVGEATISNPISIYRTAVTVPAEILAIAVVSENAATCYALWTRENQARFNEYVRGQRAKQTGR